MSNEYTVKDDNRRGSAAVAVLAGLFVIALVSSIYNHDEDEKAKVRDAQKADITYALMAQIESNCITYAQVNGTPPGSDNELSIACIKYTPSDEAYSTLQKGNPKDAWNKPFVMSYRGKRMIIATGGPDREINTDDDLERAITFK